MPDDNPEPEQPADTKPEAPVSRLPLGYYGGKEPGQSHSYMGHVRPHSPLDMWLTHDQRVQMAMLSAADPRRADVVAGRTLAEFATQYEARRLEEQSQLDLDHERSATPENPIDGTAGPAGCKPTAEDVKAALCSGDFRAATRIRCKLDNCTAEEGYRRAFKSIRGAETTKRSAYYRWIEGRHNAPRWADEHMRAWLMSTPV